MVPGASRDRVPNRARRLEFFDRATERQQQRQDGRQTAAADAERGWRREDLYTRGRAG
jgi:hypothetical protein